MAESSPTFSLFSNQPRWLVLSVIILVWSVCASIRNGGGTRLPSLLPGANAQTAGIPLCAVACAASSGNELGCGENLNLPCACPHNEFEPAVSDCMLKNCTAKDQEIGQQSIHAACVLIRNTITTTGPTNTPGPTNTTAPPPVCTTDSPTSSPTGPANGTSTVDSTSPSSNSTTSSSDTTTPPTSSSSSTTPPPTSPRTPPPTSTSTTTVLETPTGPAPGSAVPQFATTPVLATALLVVLGLVAML